MFSDLFKPAVVNAVGTLLTVPVIVFLLKGWLGFSPLVNLLLTAGVVLQATGTLIFIINQLQKR